MHKNFTLVITLSAVLLLAGFGCGTKKMMENAMEKELEQGFGGNADVDVDDDKVTIEIEDGISYQAGEEVDLPEDFPDDVYVIDGKIIASMENMMFRGHSVSILVNKTKEEAGEIYKEKLPKDGWKIQSSMNLPETVMLTARKDDRTVSVTIADDEDQGGTVVILNVVNDTERTY